MTQGDESREEREYRVRGRDGRVYNVCMCVCARAYVYVCMHACVSAYILICKLEAETRFKLTSVSKLILLTVHSFRGLGPCVCRSCAC